MVENPFAEEYILARNVLMEALGALGAHREAVILVGAQAVYMQVGEGDFGIPPYTTDADIAFDPDLVMPTPKLDQRLEEAGFVLDRSDLNAVGSWVKDGVAVDLMVPSSLGGSGRRSARIEGQSKNVIRKTHGLEACLIDNDEMNVASFGNFDQQSFAIKVAGPAGLLTAKLIKLEERIEADPSGRAGRVSNKDALDIFRLLQYDAVKLQHRMRKVIANPRSSQASIQAVTYLKTAFAKPNLIGCQMAADAARGYANADEVCMRASILASRLAESVAGYIP